MKKRGLQLGRERKDPYVHDLMDFIMKGGGSREARRSGWTVHASTICSTSSGCIIKYGHPARPPRPRATHERPAAPSRARAMREAVATLSPLRSRATTTPGACSPVQCRTAPPAQNAAPALARLLPGYRVQPPRVLPGCFVCRPSGGSCAAAARAARWPCLQAQPPVVLSALVRRAAGHR